MKKLKPWILFYGMTIAAVLAAAHWGSQAVTVVAEHTPPDPKSVIIVDPGHGGEDGGAVSCTGLPESQYNLEIALRLYDLFRFLGYPAQMTRTEDVSIYTKGETLAQKKISDLKERVKLVQQTENALLVSIHQNKFSQSHYAGAQVFYGSHPLSKQLAQSLQEHFHATVNPGSSRSSKQSKGVYLMEHVTCPAILVECGFLSNPPEEALLRSPEYQKKLCCVIACAVSTFLEG